MAQNFVKRQAVRQATRIVPRAQVRAQGMPAKKNAHPVAVLAQPMTPRQPFSRKHFQTSTFKQLLIIINGYLTVINHY